MKEGLPDYEGISISVGISMFSSAVHSLPGAFYMSITKLDYVPTELIFYWAIPPLTHLGSGIYEYIRYTKKKMAGTLSGHSTGSGGASSPARSGSSTVPSSGSTPSKLEEKVKKHEIKIKDIPNPWDIDIPKIENIARSGEHYG